VSIDAVVEFIRALDEDDELRKRCDEVLEADGPDGVVKLAAERGLEFTAQEFTESVTIEGELDDGELDKVAGGLVLNRRLTLSPRVFRSTSSRGISRFRNVAGAGGDQEPDEEPMPT
jgi:predicted ribosomally synthesized peptide with nif11-like leader